MKKLSYLIVLTLILGLVLTGCLLSNVGQVPTSEQSDIAYLTKHTEEKPFEINLIAGGGNPASEIDVGGVLIWNDAGTLYVKYVITEEGWFLTETHLHVANGLDLIPQTKKGNPIPGQFEYCNEHDYFTEYTYVITNTWGIYTPLYIAAHAVVVKLEPIVGCYETVWQIGDVETIDLVTGQLTCYYDELNRDESAVNPWPTFTNPFVIGITPDNEFPYNSNYAYLYATDFNVDWNGNLPFGGRLILSWSPGKSSALETKIITSLDSGETATFTEKGGTSLIGWKSYKLVESTMTLNPIESGPHEFRFQTTSGDGTFWDWVRLEKPCLQCVQQETAWGDGTEFPGKNWATYITYGIQGYLERWPETGMAYVGYEDMTGGDFDYNDFGMEMSVTETHSYLGLEDIKMTFVGRLKLAGYQHKIHIKWSDSVSGHVDVEYYNNVGGSVGTYDSDFTGEVDVVVFNNTSSVIDYTTEVHITFDAPAASSMLPPYDPYMFVYNTGQTFHIGETQSKMTPAGQADLPYILVVPKTWAPPAEGKSIWTVYGYFDDFYVTGSPADWYDTWTGPNSTI